MNMNMNITITNVSNADELEQFTPVDGQWFLDGSSEDRSRDGIEQSVRNYMDADFEIDVNLFQMDGREITGDMPSEGAFIATRIN